MNRGQLKLLFVGDPHFGRQPSYLTPGKWRKYVTDMLNAALVAAQRAGAHALVILGDVFDSNHPHPLDNAEFTEFVQSAAAVNMEVIVIPGNHDYGDADYTALAPYERMRDSVQVITTPITLKMRGVPVRFYPWAPPDVKHAIGDIKDKTPYLIIHHEEIKGAKMDNGWLSGANFVPRKQDFAVGGHLHTHQLVGKNAIFVGTALPHHWNHQTKGFTILKAKMIGGKLDVQTAQAPYVPPFFLRECTLAEFEKEAKKETRKVYYRVHVSAGQKLPDDKRIVSVKRIVDPVVLNDNDKKKSRSMADLPNPLTWLVVNNFDKSKHARVMRVLDSIKRNEEED